MFHMHEGKWIRTKQTWSIGKEGKTELTGIEKVRGWVFILDTSLKIFGFAAIFVPVILFFQSQKAAIKTARDTKAFEAYSNLQLHTHYFLQTYQLHADSSNQLANTIVYTDVPKADLYLPNQLRVDADELAKSVHITALAAQIRNQIERHKEVNQISCSDTAKLVIFHKLVVELQELTLRLSTSTRESDNFSEEANAIYRDWDQKVQNQCNQKSETDSREVTQQVNGAFKGYVQNYQSICTRLDKLVADFDAKLQPVFAGLND